MNIADPVHGDAAERWGGWFWRDPGGHEHFRRCSYCGCIHPEDLIAEPRWHAEWADMKYGWPHKFYASIPDRNGELDWLGGSTHDMDDDALARYGWKRVANLTRAERRACKRARIDLDTYKVVGVRVRDSHSAKFYTVHLADPALPPETVDAVQRRSGRVFTFHDGLVSWRPYDVRADRGGAC